MVSEQAIFARRNTLIRESNRLSEGQSLNAIEHQYREVLVSIIKTQLKELDWVLGNK